MKIYRVVPNVHRHRCLSRNLIPGPWWPEGIDLGSKAEWQFRGVEGLPLPHPGNAYRAYPPEYPLGDFPPLTMNIPVLSKRALAVLKGLGSPCHAVPITVDGEVFFALQPVAVPGAFVAERSRGLAMSGGEVYLYYQRYFNPENIDREFFSLAEHHPFSDLYMTDRFVDEAKRAGLAGLECAELVFDEDGPLIPVYPPTDPATVQPMAGRSELESAMIRWRCAMWDYGPNETREALGRALATGLLSFADTRPRLLRDYTPSAV